VTRDWRTASSLIALFLSGMVGEDFWCKAGTRWREEREWKSNKENGSHSYRHRATIEATRRSANTEQKAAAALPGGVSLLAFLLAFRLKPPAQRDGE
jgi:hypothetical protein